MTPIDFLTSTDAETSDYSSQDGYDLNEFIVHLKDRPLLSAFAQQSISFIQQLSQLLLKDTRCKSYPELVALGFWLRKNNLYKLLQQQGFTASAELTPTLERAPIGLAVHFTPANVDTMFIYSWITSLLLGNSNIVRVASKDSELQSLLLTLIKQLFGMPEHRAIAVRNYFISYPRQSKYTAQLCANADARLIWGGDQSVANIKAYRTPEKCIDLCFTDKFSAAIVADINAENVQQTAQLLWRDTQPYLQQACSSPRILYWLANGSDTEAWLKELLQILNGLAKQNIHAGWHTISQANEHLVTAQQIMASSKHEIPAQLVYHASVSGICVTSATPEMLEIHSGNGLFICVLCDSIEAVFDHIAALDSDKLQTLTYINVSATELFKHKQNKSITSIDRIVPMGQALDFSFHWDGYDLLRELSTDAAPAKRKGVSNSA